MRERPRGVTVVAGLTLLAAVGDFVFAILVLALCSVGGPPPSGSHPSPFVYLLVWSPLVLSLVSFIVAAGIFNRTRSAWYWSILLWIASAVYHDIVALMLFRGMNLVLMMATLSLATFVSAVFIVYFQSEQVKTYFLEPSN